MNDDNNNNSRLSDIFRKLVSSGLAGASLLNEEGLKGLPKELIGQLVQNAKSTKDELMQSVAQGVTEYLEKVNFQKEIEKLMGDFEVTLTTTVRFDRRDKGKKSKKVKEEVVEEVEEDDEE